MAGRTEGWARAFCFHSPFEIHPISLIWAWRQPWEVGILLDMQNCELGPRQARAYLRQYLRAVRRQLENGPGPPMKFSEFLQSRRTRRPSTE